MDRAVAVDSLRHSTLFAGFTDEQLLEVTKVGLQRDYGPGDRIVSFGAPASSLFIVLSGAVEVTVEGTLIHTLGSGSHIGEIALLDEVATRTADVSALEPTSLLELQRSHLLGLIGGSPEIAIGMIHELVHRLRLTTDALRRLAAAAPEAAAETGVDLHPAPQVTLGAIEFALAEHEDL